MTQITLDPAGDEINLVDPDGNATTWTYSQVNLPLTETNSLGTTTTTYNLDHKVTSIEDADGRMRDFVYHNDQRLTAEHWMSGTTVVASMNYGYDLDNELTSAGDANSAYAFAYNGDGQVTTVNNAGTPNVPDVVLTDGYDPTNQLTSATYTTASGGHQPANESFSFDANGNRNSTGYTTGSGNLLTSDGTFNYQHDADGNTTVRTRISNAYATDYRTTYTWDYRNRLTDVDYYDNNSVLTKHVHYVYGVFDHLLATEVDPNGGGTYTQIEHYVLDVSPNTPSAGIPGTALAQPVLQFDGEGNLTARFLVALDPTGGKAVLAQEPVASLTQGGATIWAADDNLGTPRDLTNNNGTLANHAVFSAFGQDVYESDPSLSYWVGFGGGHIDANTGLVSDYHRWYDPVSGRWTSPDPLDFAARDANLARYIGNSPGQATDESGLSPNPTDPTQQITLQLNEHFDQESSQLLSQMFWQFGKHFENVAQIQTDLATANILYAYAAAKVAYYETMIATVGIRQTMLTAMIKGLKQAKVENIDQRIGFINAAKWLISNFTEYAFLSMYTILHNDLITLENEFRAIDALHKWLLDNE